MELGLFQQQTMKLVMTNELRQAISILQFSRQELTDFIREQALENPLIELKEPSFHETSGLFGKPADSSYNPFEHIESQGPDLHADLLQQMRYLHLDESTSKLTSYLIYLLDEDGYFRANTEEVAAELRKPTEQVDQALMIIQKLEPAGVGARSLKECLLLQIKRLAPDNRIARNIIENYLEMLAEQESPALANELGEPVESVKRAVNVIKQLNPKPGADFTNEMPEFIIPDLTIKKELGKYVVVLHDQFLPKIQSSSQYESLLSKSAQTNTVHYVRQKYKQVNWLINSIEQRRTTLLRVTEAIIKNQHPFLEQGPRALAPLTLKDIASEIDVHESTVSRAVKGKYVQTPLGLYELKAFFNSRVRTSNGNDVSSTRAKALIKEMIDTEDDTRPLSDDKISTVLKNENDIAISRRTVAKYRSQLRIPSSSKRKISK